MRNWRDLVAGFVRRFGVFSEAMSERELDWWSPLADVRQAVGRVEGILEAVTHRLDRLEADVKGVRNTLFSLLVVTIAGLIAVIATLLVKL